jgi:peptidoglycan/LPS O-acetylase OafA/YrhL
MKQNIIGIHSLRGLAALAIVVFHTHGINNLPLPPSMMFINNYFGLGVPLFFIISAFSLFYSTSSRIGQDGWLSAYVIRRVMRVLPLFYALILFNCVYIPVQFGVFLSPMAVAASMSFLYNLAPGQHESVVWAGWTIGVEMLFYMVVPYLLVFVQSTGGAIAFLIAAVVCSAQFFKLYTVGNYPPGYAYMSFLASIGVFAYGILAYFLFKRLSINGPISWKITSVVTICVAIVGLLTIWKEPILTSYVGNRSLVWGPFFTLLVISQAITPVALISNRIFAYLGNLSFGLYLCHPPVVYLLKATYGRIYSWDLGLEASFLICTLLTFACVIPVAVLAHRFVEKPGMKLGERLIFKKYGVDYARA